MKYLFLVFFLTISLSALDKVSVQLEWKHQFEFAGFYAAKEKGYYEENGLDVEIKEFHNGIKTVEDVLKGKTTYGLSSSQLILEYLSGKDVVLLASYFKKNALVIVTKPEIKKVEDLNNKKLMINKNEIESTSLGVLLKEHNMSVKNIDIVEHTYNIDPFVNGSVDGMSAFISNQPFLLDKLGVKYNVFNPAQDGIYSYDLELFTSLKEAKSHPERTRRFIAATKRGWEYALAHQEEISKLIFDKYTKRKSIQALQYEAKVTEDLIRKDIFEIGLVVLDLVKVNLNMYERLGLVDKELKIDDFIFKNQTNLTFDEEEREFIKSHPVITFSDVVWEPFAKIDENGEYSGIFKDYYKLLENRTGLKFEFKKIGDGVNFQSVLDALRDKKIDMIDGTGKTEERKKYASFVGPLMQVSLAIVSNKYNRYSSMESLKKKKIAVASGSTAYEYIKEKYPYLELIVTNSVEEGIELVIQNSADAMLDNIVVLNHVINQSYQNSPVEITGISDYEFTIFGLIRNDYPILQNILNKAIRSIDQQELIAINYQLLQTSIKPFSEKKLNLSPAEEEFLSKTTELKMCVDPEWMPFEKLSNGKHIGIAADYIEEISKVLDIPIEALNVKSWDESMQRGLNKECDIFSMISKTPFREKFINFSTPYLTLPVVLATKNEKSFIGSFDELEGKKIALVKGYSIVYYMQEHYPNIEYILVDSISQGLEKVEKGEVYGYMDNLMVISHYIQLEFSGNLKISGRLENNLEFSIGSRNDKPELNSILNKAIESIPESRKQEIINKWVNVNFETGIDYDLTIKVVGGAFIIFLFMLYRNKVLRDYNQKLQVLNDELEEVNRVKNTFFANVSHEVRTPLNGIINMTYLVLQSKLTKLQREQITQIQKASDSLLEIINDILDYSKLEAHKLEIQKVKFNLKKMVLDVIDLVRIDANERGLSVELKYDETIPSYLLGDEIRLKQVLTNLLSNGIKFTNSGYVNISIKKMENDIYRFEVKDSGIGIDKANIEKLFNSFAQADGSISRKYGGTGLGLAISKEIVELMGGKIWVHSKEGVGSSFYFEVTLPTVDDDEVFIEEDIIEVTEKTTPKIRDKKNIESEEYIDTLFENLKVALHKSRPMECKPIIDELLEYNLNESKEKLLFDLEKAVSKHRFKDAIEILESHNG